jgi:hypothetical protein
MRRRLLGRGMGRRIRPGWGIRSFEIPTAWGNALMLKTCKRIRHYI